MTTELMSVSNTEQSIQLNMSEQKTIIGLTGGRGVLGRELVKTWSNLNRNIEINLFEGDIRNRNDIDQWLNNVEHFHGIVHLAALVPTVEVDRDPFKAFQVNTQGTLNLLESIRSRFQTKNTDQCPWIFYASTSHVYSSHEQGLSVDENSPLNPITTYGLTKCQADQWTQIYRNKYNLPICTGRIFSYSSPDQPKTYFIPSLIEKLKHAQVNDRLEIRGLDGTRDFLTTEEIVKIIYELSIRQSVGTFNIGAGLPTKLFDVALSLQRRLTRNDLTIVSTGTDTNHLVADIKRLVDLGIRPNFQLEHLLDSFFA